MSADAGAGLEDIHARVLVGDADDLRHVHAAAAADLRKLVCEGDVYIAEGVLHDLRHFRSLDVRDDYVALAEGEIDLLYRLSGGCVVTADGAGVVYKLLEHVAGDDTLRRVGKVHMLAAFRHDGANLSVDSARGYSGLNDDYRAVAAVRQHVAQRVHDGGGVHLFAVGQVGRGHGDYIKILCGIIAAEVYTPALPRLSKKLRQALFLKGHIAPAEPVNGLLPVADGLHVHAVRRKHQRRGQTYISGSNNTNSHSFPLFSYCAALSARAVHKDLFFYHGLRRVQYVFIAFKMQQLRPEDVYRGAQRHLNKQRDHIRQTENAHAQHRAAHSKRQQH